MKIFLKYVQMAIILFFFFYSHSERVSASMLSRTSHFQNIFCVLMKKRHQGEKLRTEMLLLGEQSLYLQIYMSNKKVYYHLLLI